MLRLRSAHCSHEILRTSLPREARRPRRGRSLARPVPGRLWRSPSAHASGGSAGPRAGAARLWPSSRASGYTPHAMGFETLRGFRTLPSHERDRLAAESREHRVPAGTVLFVEGQPARYLWAVGQGLVRIVSMHRGGREMILELIPPGELFGAMGVLQDRPYPATAVAAAESVVWRIPATLTRELCQCYPALRATILEQVAGRLRLAHERLRSVALDRVDQRLARLLLGLAERIGREQGSPAVLALTRQQLAQMVGTTVETAIRVTRRWHAAGIIATGRAQLRLLDPEALRHIAEGDAP